MLNIDLKGKTAFVAGVADDQGFGFAIAKSLAEAGATVFVGTWPPVLNLFQKGLERGKFDKSMVMSDGSKLKFEKIYPFDAAYDEMTDVPDEVKEDKRYRELPDYTISGCAKRMEEDLGGKGLDIMIHSLAFSSEVKKPMLEISRQGYLTALSASSYSFVSMCRNFGPFMNAGGHAMALSFLGGTRAVPGYGGAMSTAKAALECDMRYLAYECGRAYGIRVNALSAGGIRSRAGRAIGFIERMLAFSTKNQPLCKELDTKEVGDTTAFLSSPLASAITGTLMFVDNGFHAMGAPVDNDATGIGDITSIHTKEGFAPFSYED